MNLLETHSSSNWTSRLILIDPWIKMCPQMSSCQKQTLTHEHHSPPDTSTVHSVIRQVRQILKGSAAQQVAVVEAER